MLLFATILFGFHGVIENDTTWSDTAYLTGDVWVNSGVTLDISPGTEVVFADSSLWDTTWHTEEDGYCMTYSNRVDFIVEGNLKVIGTIEDSINFHSQAEEDAGRGRIILAGEWDSLRYCSVTERGVSVPYTWVENTHMEMSKCRFEKVQGIYGEKSRLVIKNSQFIEISGYALRLYGGILFVEDCLFFDTENLEIGYYCMGVINGVELDSCLVNNVLVDGALGITKQIAGEDAVGCYCFACWQVQILNSVFKNFRGGNGGPSTGHGGQGGRGCGIYLEECNYVLVSNNQIESISGGDGEGDDVEIPPYGGSGLGLYLKDCADVSIDKNKISHLYGGYGELNPDGAGASWALVCYNSSPEIINNEFNSAERYVHIHKSSHPIIGGAPDKSNRFLGLADKKYVIYNDSPNDIDATWNFWECSPSMIDSLIYDYYDDPTKGIVHYDNFTDVEEEESVTQPFTLRSNLVNDVLHVSLSRNYAGVEPRLSLFDASGRRVLSKPVSGSEIEIDVSAFPRGVYFLSVNTPEEPRITRKVILN